jgi:transposase
VIDPLGRQLGQATFETTIAGFKALLAWANDVGPITLAGVEGTGAYGAGLARFLTAEGVTVVEVDRPDRKTRRDQGKSDPIDAYAAARAAASGRASGTPKSRTGDVEAVRVLRVARTGAVRARARALTQLKSLIVTAPDALRAQLAGLNGAKLVTTCARLRPARGAAPTPSPFAKRPPRPGRLVDPSAATKRSLASIAQRVLQLDVEIAELDDDLEALLTPLAPTLLELMGVGLDVAGQLLVTFGDNAERIASEAAFAHLCGVAPIPANSGKNQNNFRLNRGGDRAANAALYRIVLCRLRYDERTRAYVERRTKQGKSKQHIIRCLKRYIAREVYNAIQADLNPDIAP